MRFKDLKSTILIGSKLSVKYNRSNVVFLNKTVDDLIEIIYRNKE